MAASRSHGIRPREPQQYVQLMALLHCASALLFTTILGSLSSSLLAATICPTVRPVNKVRPTRQREQSARPRGARRRSGRSRGNWQPSYRSGQPRGGRSSCAQSAARCGCVAHRRSGRSGWGALGLAGTRSRPFRRLVQRLGGCGRRHGHALRSAPWARRARRRSKPRWPDAAPPVGSMASGRPSPLAIVRAFAVRPPREPPTRSRAAPFLRLPNADGRERWCYRPWPRCRVPPWPDPTPPAGHPTRPPRSSAGTGDRQKDHLLKRSCRSRQGTPVRAIQNIPSGIRRWSAGGRPERPPDPTTNGAKNAHSSSLIRPRTTAALQKPALHHAPPQNGSDLVNAA